MKTENKNLIELAGCMLQVDDIINEFTIHQKPSSNVEYFGTDNRTARFFVQFKSGTSYIYSEVEKRVLDDSTTAESIGKFVNINIVGKFKSEKITERLVKPLSPNDIADNAEEPLSNNSDHPEF